MITFKNYNFDYCRYLIITSTIILFGILFKIYDKRPYVITELALLTFGLLISFIFLSSNTYKFSRISKVFLFFLLYLFIYNLSMAFLRPLEVDISFYDALFFSISEFRLSTLGYFLPLLFIPLVKIEHDKIIKIFLLLSKIAVVYTIFEQVISLLGFRTFFEMLYFNSGVVTSNMIGVKNFGIYRIWGLVGSPQILGVFHIMTLALFLFSKNSRWAILSFLCIFLSTSKTAILIFILLVFLYLIVNKKYLLFTVFTLLILFISTSLYLFNAYLVEQMRYDYLYLQQFVQSIQGFFILLINQIDRETGLAYGDGAVYLNKTGPLMTVYEYFRSNPLELFFGKGITYSFMGADQLRDTAFGQPDLKVADQFYMGLSSDFYILTYFEQYGIFGFVFFTIIYFIYPVLKLFKHNNYILYIPIIFYLSCFHYPPQISKIVMLFVALSIWYLYLRQENNDEGLDANNVSKI